MALKLNELRMSFTEALEQYLDAREEWTTGRVAKYGPNTRAKMHEAAEHIDAMTDLATIAQALCHLVDSRSVRHFGDQDYVAARRIVDGLFAPTARVPSGTPTFPFFAVVCARCGCSAAPDAFDAAGNHIGCSNRTT